jgi:hypothetical protein
MYSVTALDKGINARIYRGEQFMGVYMRVVFVILLGLDSFSLAIWLVPCTCQKYYEARNWYNVRRW